MSKEIDLKDLYQYAQQWRQSGEQSLVNISSAHIIGHTFLFAAIATLASTSKPHWALALLDSLLCGVGVFLCWQMGMAFRISRVKNHYWDKFMRTLEKQPNKLAFDEGENGVRYEPQNELLCLERSGQICLVRCTPMQDVDRLTKKALSRSAQGKFIGKRLLTYPKAFTCIYVLITIYAWLNFLLLSNHVGG